MEPYGRESEVSLKDVLWNFGQFLSNVEMSHSRLIRNLENMFVSPISSFKVS